MRLLERLFSVLKAAAHGVVDSMEDRRLLAKQCIREAQLALVAKRARLPELRDHQQRLSQESERLKALMERLDKDVELALQDNGDELAKVALRRLLPLSEAEQRLANRRLALRDEETRLCDTLAIQEQELAILKTRLSAEVAAEGTGSCVDSYESPVITEHDVELELLRRRRAGAATRNAEGS